MFNNMFLFFLLAFFPTLNLFNNWINIIYYLPVGFYLHEFYKNDFRSIKLNNFQSRKKD